MTQNKTTYETGATSHAVNDLILFTDNTQKLALFRDMLYKEAITQQELANDPWGFDIDWTLRNLFLNRMWKEAEYAYRSEFPTSHKHITSMSGKAKREFAELYAKDFHTWKKENGYA